MVSLMPFPLWAGPRLARCRIPEPWRITRRWGYSALAEVLLLPGAEEKRKPNNPGSMHCSASPEVFTALESLRNPLAVVLASDLVLRRMVSSICGPLHRQGLPKLQRTGASELFGGKLVIMSGCLSQGKL